MNDTPNLNDSTTDPEPRYASDSTIARQIALQTLYEFDIAGHNPLEVLARHLRMQEPPPRAARMAQTLVRGVNTFRTQLDHVVEQRAEEFPVDLLAVIDRNILRIALYEFAVWGATPVGAAIDEAVELAKDFAAEGAPSFINGVLRSIALDDDLVESLHQDGSQEAEDEESHEDS
ncbi:MAG: transcription antitermination factor NusB [Anaerolineae bacterium]|nr:transcription antitermination factor NusB [Anaerolineae bacterium]NUQ02737.1 transcription antitermination factor NusB [Anaerolineae bacterium]